MRWRERAEQDRGATEVAAWAAFRQVAPSIVSDSNPPICIRIFSSTRAFLSHSS